MKIVCSITIAILAMFSSVTGLSSHRDARKFAQNEKPIQIILSSEKLMYKRHDDIALNAMIKNQSLREMYVYGNLEWGYYASLTLCVRDATGKEVTPNFIAGAITHFSDPSDTSQFVKLLPFHFLGKTYKKSTNDLNIEKPGKYSIYAEYHSPIPSSKVGVKPFFAKENGIVQSNVLSIVIE